MTTFIVRLELHPSDQEQAHSALHDAMEAAGFSRIYQAGDGVRYHLPSFEYCMVAAGSVETIRDLAQDAAEKVTSLFMVVASETSNIAVAGLVPVKDAVRPVVRAASPVEDHPIEAKAA